MVSRRRRRVLNSAAPSEWQPSEWHPEDGNRVIGPAAAATVASSPSGQARYPPVGTWRRWTWSASRPARSPPVRRRRRERRRQWVWSPAADGSQVPGDEPPVEVLPRYETRKPRSFWLRSRLLILIAAVWGLLFWYALSSDPLLTVHDGLVQTWNSKWWLAVLFAAELVRADPLHRLRALGRVQPLLGGPGVSRPTAPKAA